jgi:hypothetical protein
VTFARCWRARRLPQHRALVFFVSCFCHSLMSILLDSALPPRHGLPLSHDSPARHPSPLPVHTPPGRRRSMSAHYRACVTARAAAAAMFAVALASRLRRRSFIIVPRGYCHRDTGVAGTATPVRLEPSHRTPLPARAHLAPVRPPYPSVRT